MQHFEFRIQGLRPAPIVLSVTTGDEDGARAMAEKMLGACEDRAQIDVWRTRRYLFTVGRPARVQRLRGQRAWPGAQAMVDSAAIEVGHAQER
jgi:hypothetical protein